MIDKSTLLDFSRINNLRNWQQEKHYIQSVILTLLSEEPLVFKGGTYLWFFHGLKRFSEDLDFTANGSIPKELASKVSKDLKLLGIENDVKVVTNTDKTLSFRISAKGPLNTSDIDLCHVYVEISKREEVIKKTIPLKLDFSVYQIPTKIIQGMDLDEVTTEKARAILTRDKPRDLYDLWYLIVNKKVKFDLITINQKLGYCNKKYSKNAFIKAVKNKKKYFEKELKPLVFDELPSFNECSKTVIKWIK